VDEKKLGQLLLVKDVITKRQLASAVQSQIKGDNRKIGEILIDKGFLTMEDLTDILLENGHSEPTPVIPTVEPPDLVEGSELSKNTKFKVSIQTMISAGVGIATMVGFWYALQADIQEAKELPAIGNIYDQEYPSKPEGYNWPRSYEQYKDNVGALQEDMDAVFETLEDYEEKIEELEKQVTELRIKVGNK
jgi:hypothetical protein